MAHHDFQEMFSSAGMPEDQIESVLKHFHAYDEAADLTSVTEYEIARSSYSVMDAYVPAGDLHSPVARYLISLGARIAAWEDQAAVLGQADAC